MEFKNSLLSNVVFVAIVLFLVYMFWTDHKERKASLHWPSTTGTITKVYLKETQRTDNTKNSFWNSSHRDYEIKINYEYDVDGRFFTGDRIEVSGPKYSSESDAEEALSEYEVGQEVSVYYNPKNPKASVLVPG